MSIKISNNKQTGAGLVELLVALVLSLFLLAGLFTIYFSMRSSFDTQNAMSALQENQTLAANVLADTIRVAGYFPYNTTDSDRNIAFPGNVTIFSTNVTWNSGQVIYATGTTAGPDKIFIRLFPQTSNTLNCLGQSSTSINPQTNEFTTMNSQNNATPNALGCTVITMGQNLTSMPIIAPILNNNINPNGGGIANLIVLMGISSAGSNNINNYLSPNQMTPADWQNVRSVEIKLQFYNPLFNPHIAATGATTDDTGQPEYIYLTRIVRLENLAQ